MFWKKTGGGGGGDYTRRNLYLTIYVLGKIFIHSGHQEVHRHCHKSCEAQGLSLREAQLIHTLSKFQSLLHELYLTNHHSSQEHAIYGTSCLLLAFLNLTTCHISNLRSLHFILSLSLSLLLAFRFFLSPFVVALLGHHGLSSK